MYPEGINDELIEVIKNNSKICKYFDIPIQHISNSILKRMNRKTTKENIEKLIKKIKKVYTPKITKPQKKRITSLRLMMFQ